MKGCNYIQEQIDEADKPDLLSFEVTEHIAECRGCETFAAERSALRMLVASSSRVSAPVNFDAVLNARLAEVKARRWSWWLGSPAYFRLGAATAGLVVMVLAAQYSGLFAGRPSPTDNRTAATDAQALAGSPAGTPIRPREHVDQTPSTPDSMRSLPGTIAVSRRSDPSYSAARTRRGDLSSRRAGVPIYLTAEDGGVVLVRGQNGEMDVQMPTVSVGAQPLMYVRAGQRTVSNVGTSF